MPMCYKYEKALREKNDEYLQKRNNACNERNQKRYANNEELRKSISEYNKMYYEKKKAKKLATV